MSNLPGGRNLSGEGGITAASPAHIRLAHRHEIHAALQLILGSRGRPASEEQVVDFLRFAVYRGIDLNDTWLAVGRDKLLWAILPVVSPGRTMLLFSPSHVPAHIKDTCICPLVDRVLQHYCHRAIDLAQVLIDPAESAAVKLYEACGFELLAELIYLDREIRRAGDATFPPGFSWQTYSPESHGDFARTISATYEQSLDCPGLNGRRHVEDVLAGHKSAGEFDPSLWFLLRDDRQGPAGVLLLNRATRTDALELVYLGLVPQQRGRRLGDVMMRRAIASAASIGARRLSLAVDSRNEPALRLYRRHGLTQLCTRSALLLDLRQRRTSVPAPQSTNA